MIASHHDRLADQRVERIGDYGFEGKKPSTMAPALTTARKTGPSLLR